MQVLDQLEMYRDIRELNTLREEVHAIRAQLATQILADFKEALTGEIFYVILFYNEIHFGSLTKKLNFLTSLSQLTHFAGNTFYNKLKAIGNKNAV